MADISKISRLLAGVQRAVNLANNELLVNNIKIKAGSGNDAHYVTFAGSLTAARTITMPNANVNLGDIATHSTAIADLQTLSGMPANSQDLGTFTGTTIPDNSTIKSALQSLETAVEAVAGDSDFADNEFRISDDADSTKKIAFEASSIATGTTRTITMPNANVNLGHIANLQALSGVSAGDEDLGTFTGSIIPDNSTIKSALQSLETEIESIPNPIFYAGVWNANTNTPDLDLASARVQGALYRVNTAGNHDFGTYGGVLSFAVGDKVVFNGSTWEKWDVNDSDIVSDDVAEGSVNLYFTNERAQDAVGNILTDTNDIDFVYNDSANEITASIKKEAITTKTLKTTVDDNDEFLIADSADSGNLKKVTKAAILQGFETDIETVVVIANLGEDAGTGVKALRWGVPANTESAGKLYKADNDTDNTETFKDLFYVVGVYVAAGELEDEEVMIVKKGKLEATAHGFTVGQPIFLGSDGNLTSTAPSADDLAVVRIGFARSANLIDVDIQVIGVN